MQDIRIRQEQPLDYEAVFTLNERAFGQPNEARLVNALRGSDAFIPELSMVAETDGRIVGHILFTKIAIRNTDADAFESLSLAPMAVEPDLQNRGIGSKLVRAGLKKAAELGYHSVIVLGHEKYYPRFGFKPASLWDIKAPYDVPDDVFLALELTEGALDGVHGTVKYPEEFDSV